MKTRLSPFSCLALLALFNPLLVFAQTPPPAGPQPWDWPGPWHMWSGVWAFWWICLLFFLFMIVVCAGIFVLGRRSHHGGPWHMMDRWQGSGRGWGDPTYSALQVLNERYARGEIQKQEYEEKKAAILSSGRP